MKDFDAAVMIHAGADVNQKIYFHRSYLYHSSVLVSGEKGCLQFLNAKVSDLCILLLNVVILVKCRVNYPKRYLRSEERPNLIC